MSDSRPIALLLTPVWPTPGGSGRALRAWDWLHTLSRHYRVHLLVDASAAPEAGADALIDGCWQAPALPVGTSRWQRGLAQLVAPLCLLDQRLTIDWVNWDLGAVLARMRERLAGQPVAKVVAFRFYLHTAAVQVAQHFPEASIELDMDDLESRTRWSVAGALWRLRRPREALRCACSALQYTLLERFLRGPYHRVWLASDEDSARLRTRLAPQCAARPNRLVSLASPDAAGPVGDGVEERSATGPARLLFVGTLNYPPNEEAVFMLVQKLVPILRRQLHQPWRLCVVGRHAPTALVELLRGAPEVEFVPDAEQIGPWYEASQVVLVPLWAGGGTKLKSIEGLVYGKPLVSTRHGMRGLPARAEEHYLAAQTPEQFATAIGRLLADPALSARLACAGRALMRRSGHG